MQEPWQGPSRLGDDRERSGRTRSVIRAADLTRTRRLRSTRLRFNMAFYDSNFNRVLITVTRAEQSTAVYTHLKGSLLGVTVPEPDAQGRIDLGFDQERNEDAAAGIRTVLDREWPDSGDWIEVTPTSQHL